MTDWRNRIIGSGEMPAGEFLANPLNWRIHPKPQQEAMAGALNEIGWIQEVIVNQQTGNLVDGHLRVTLALRNGDQTPVPVKFVDLTPEEEALALLSLDPIAAMAASDKQKVDELLREVQTGEAGLRAMLAELAEANGLDYGKEEPPADPGAQVEKAEELRQKWGVESGQLWQLGEHRLICGDCTDAAVVARVMGGEKADCVFTSPPYAVGVDYGETYQDTIDNLRGMLPKLSRLWSSIVEDGGFAVVNFGDVASGRNITKADEPCEYPMAIEYWPVFRADGWLLWSRRIWCKPNPRVHSLQCIQSNRAATDWEHLWTWKRPGKAIVARVDGELRSASGWYQSSQMHGVDIGKEEHGAGMAVGIACWMVNVHSREGNIVHEPFCGTGTTLIACEQLKRLCFGSEISPAYCAVAIQRWVDMTGREPVLIGTQ